MRRLRMTALAGIVPHDRARLGRPYIDSYRTLKKGAPEGLPFQYCSIPHLGILPPFKAPPKVGPYSSHGPSAVEIIDLAQLGRRPVAQTLYRGMNDGDCLQDARRRRTHSGP